VIRGYTRERVVRARGARPGTAIAGVADVPVTPGLAGVPVTPGLAGVPVAGAVRAPSAAPALGGRASPASPRSARANAAYAGLGVKSRWSSPKLSSCELGSVPLSRRL